MRRAAQVLACALVAHAGLCAPARAQQPDGALRCDPSTTHLDIQGPARVSGMGPVSLSALPRGRYLWTARGTGFAMARGRFTRDENGLRFRSFAGPGALLRPPGMLHLARSERRGWYYLGAGTTSGVAWWLSAEAARDADDQLQQAEQQFSMASGSADSATLAGLQAQVTTAREQQRDDHRIRDIWAIYFGAIWAGAGVEAWLMTPRATVASSPGEYLVTLPGTNGWRAAICSALVPGAGQRVLGRDGRASTFSTIIAATMAGAILAQDQVLAARRDYYAAKRQRDASPAGVDRFQVQAAMDDAESEEDAYSTLRSVMLGVAAPVYLWSVVDAFLGGRRAASVAASRRAPAVSLAPTVDGVRLALTLRLR